MIITRWQAPIVPTKQQVHMILESEGLEPFDEACPAHAKIQDRRHPFAEIRVVIEGEMIFNISGNQFALRPGDRLEIPANTKHSYVAHGPNGCISVCAKTI